jgi:hypothetical protein
MLKKTTSGAKLQVVAPFEQVAVQLDLSVVNGQVPGRKPAESTLQFQSEASSSQTARAGCCSGQFVDLSKRRLEFLQSRGSTDQQGVSSIPSFAPLSVHGSKPSLEGTAVIDRDEVIVQPADGSISNYSSLGHAQPEAKVQLLHRLLSTLSANERAAIRDFYTGGFTQEEACIKHGLSMEDFRSLRASLKLRVAIFSTPTMDLAVTA